eukprot:SM000048S16606  [mRNA]  locus=s48:681449:683254:- [translate_table: standard]
MKARSNTLSRYRWAPVPPGAGPPLRRRDGKDGAGAAEAPPPPQRKPRYLPLSFAIYGVTGRLVGCRLAQVAELIARHLAEEASRAAAEQAAAAELERQAKEGEEEDDAEATATPRLADAPGAEAVPMSLDEDGPAPADLREAPHGDTPGGGQMELDDAETVLVSGEREGDAALDDIDRDGPSHPEGGQHPAAEGDVGAAAEAVEDASAVETARAEQANGAAGPSTPRSDHRPPIEDDGFAERCERRPAGEDGVAADLRVLVEMDEVDDAHHRVPQAAAAAAGADEQALVSSSQGLEALAGAAHAAPAEGSAAGFGADDRAGSALGASAMEKTFAISGDDKDHLKVGNSEEEIAVAGSLGLGISSEDSLHRQGATQKFTDSGPVDGLPSELLFNLARAP